MSSFRLFVLVGLPLIFLLIIVGIVLWMCFPKQFKEIFPCCPCYLEQKIKIIKVPVEIPFMVPVDIDVPPPTYEGMVHSTSI